MTQVGDRIDNTGKGMKESMCLTTKESHGEFGAMGGLSVNRVRWWGSV